jgi:hypothetical protein
MMDAAGDPEGPLWAAPRARTEIIAAGESLRRRRAWLRWIVLAALVGHIVSVILPLVRTLGGAGPALTGFAAGPWVFMAYLWFTL